MITPNVIFFLDIRSFALPRLVHSVVARHSRAHPAKPPLMLSRVSFHAQDECKSGGRSPPKTRFHAWNRQEGDLTASNFFAVRQIGGARTGSDRQRQEEDSRRKTAACEDCESRGKGPCSSTQLAECVRSCKTSHAADGVDHSYSRCRRRLAQVFRRDCPEDGEKGCLQADHREQEHQNGSRAASNG